MKILKFVIFSLLPFFILACGEGETVKTEKGKRNDAKALNSKVKQVLIGEDVGSVNITFNNIPGLETALEDYYSFDEVYALKIIERGGEYWLSGKGASPDDSLHYAFALQLHQQNGGELYLTKGEITSQTCTAKGCCADCSITIVDKLSGFCDCITEDCTETVSEKACKHSVTNLTESTAELNSMIETLGAL